MGFFSSRRAEPSPLSSSRSSLAGNSSFVSGPDEHSVTQLIRSRFYGKSKKLRNDGKSNLKPSYTPSVASIAEVGPETQLSEASKVGREASSTMNQPSSSKPHLHRTSFDLNSMTLAQRLDELEVANREGLLDDDEFRLLRQNLFERHSSSSAIPSETPIVPSIVASKSKKPTNDRPAKTASIRTQSTISSAMSNLVRKATRRTTRSNSNATLADTDSVRSFSSRTSSNRLALPESRQIFRQASNASMNTQNSRAIPLDVRSVVSARSMRSMATQSDRHGNGVSRGAARSIRNGEPPPSSFSSRRLALWAQEDDRVRTAAELRLEIAETEAEAQRLLDAFNGLELSALSRHRENYPSPSTGPSTDSEIVSRDSAWTLIPDQASAFGPDVYCGRTISDRGRSMLEGSSVRLRQLTHNRLDVHDTLHPRDVLNGPDFRMHKPSDNSDYSALVKATIQAEIEDIRRRKIDVTDRYQQRLDYLRARLKGAEIHERLLRK